MNQQQIKELILVILSHPEAEEGLYLENFSTTHEEEERPVIDVDELTLLDNLKDLISEGKVKIDDSSEKIIFMLDHSST